MNNKQTSFPSLDANQRLQLFTEILRGVSRSFYLTLRVLPNSIREPIGLAYLLARAADTLADTMIVSHAKRLEFLRAYREQVNSDSLSSQVSEIQSSLAQHQSNPDEKKLLELMPQLFSLLAAQPLEDKTRIRKVVNTLITGMEFDLETFPVEESGELGALTKPEELDRYTYLVAGCVGEFWTEMMMAHVPALKRWDQKKFADLGIRLGKALQLTNILRDLPRDLRIGRCYLPEEVLNKHQLSPKALLDVENSELAQPCLEEHLEITRQHYLAALEYVVSIPRHCIRLRLAALWPLLIGLVTIEQLAENRRWLDADQVIKVERRWVYKMIGRSLLLIPSNNLIKRWVAKLAKR